ncbi:MAG: PD-(D/E)XK nuclease family transposase [Methylobacter sp.]|nr:PD-(D/E)XK nuclease family transposase [Methylobacter sp.]
MQHAIDPKIDCVFKALLGSDENRNLLIHFLNTFLAQELSEPLVWVDILNPYNDKEFLSDKLSIVDVKFIAGRGMLPRPKRFALVKCRHRTQLSQKR